MMGFDVFGWIKRKAAEAVVQGVADGVKAITPEGEQPPADLGELRAMLAASVGTAVPAKALPAAAVAGVASVAGAAGEPIEAAAAEPAKGKKAKA
jgi:hypothetical protein